MIARLITFLFASLFISGCGKETPPMDEQLIVNVLTDIHIAEGLINSHHPVIIRDSLYPHYVKQVFVKNDIVQEEFEVALAYMHRNPEYMSGIYKEVLAELAKISLNLDDAEQRKRDLENDDKVDSKAVKDQLSTSTKQPQR